MKKNFHWKSFDEKVFLSSDNGGNAIFSTFDN